MFNVTVLVILVLSSIANYFREKRESDLKANENARKARAEARHAKKHKLKYKENVEIEAFTNYIGM